MKSYERTMEIVGEGLAASRDYLAAQKEQRDADYLDAVMNPRPETQPAEILDFPAETQADEAA